MQLIDFFTTKIQVPMPLSLTTSTITIINPIVHLLGFTDSCFIVMFISILISHYIQIKKLGSHEGGKIKQIFIKNVAYQVFLILLFPRIVHIEQYFMDLNIFIFNVN